MSERMENNDSSLRSFEPIIGLEIHAQLNTKTKLFCSCPIKFGAEPNTLVCPVCLGLPGALPVLNRKAVEYAVKVAIALKMKINNLSFFARKNYFYPDLPKGYQITQYHKPLAEEGYLEIISNGKKKKIGIERLTLEEDAGKMLHDIPGYQDRSLIDFNRSGVPLIEIVTKPDISSPEEAVEFFSLLRSTLIYLGINDGNMEEGNLRCDANISLKRRGEKGLGTRTEIKNLNSFKFLKSALRYEIERQEKILLSGGEVHMETKTFNSSSGETIVMRSKEEAHDYRYFPEPDLPPLFIPEDLIEKLKNEIPELPFEKIEKFIRVYELSIEQAITLSQSVELANYFEEVVKLTSLPRKSANWILGDVMKYLNENKIGIQFYPVSSLALSELIIEVENRKIPRNIGREILMKMARERKNLKELISEKIFAIIDEEALKNIIKEFIQENKKALDDWVKGKTQVFGFFMGEVMKRVGSKADANTVKKILKESLDEYCKSG
ncbi:MAG: Asp-tRNA(Asn)/Glu-tRNA(Gln) amidotransferase subunit GatB [Candidatus Aminicenantia bacterium]